ncbi:MAG: winged helix-turn-helix domain-containing protein [Myxococcota bacterium]|nr:winged helix-turn-helix domain-containing protein [Myxococcota bacterium]
MEAQILSNKLELGHCSVDLDSHQVERDGVCLPLRPQEAELLSFFVSRPGEALSRETLYEAVWGEVIEGRSLDVAVSMLRSKIEKDASAPEHLLTVHGLGYRFIPPLNSLDMGRVGSNLAEVPDVFFGRAQSLTELQSLLAEPGSTVLIKGPGGMGKTRLAKHFSRQWSGSGVVFVDLAECESKMAVEYALALELGVSLSMEGAAAEESVVLHKALQDANDALLILDNLEQVSAPVTEWLERWRCAAPDIRWLLTSRTVTEVSGCALIELRPLSLEEGVELLVSRMNARIPGLEVGELERSSMREICQSLDGIPLAIELVAGQLALYGAEALHRQIVHGVASLSAARVDLPQRHHHIDRVLSWSWNLLGDREREVLAVCALWRGRFSKEAVVSIGVRDCEDVDVEQALRKLVDASMVQELETPGVYRIYEGVRRWCSDQPTFQAQEEWARMAHARWVLNQSDGLARELASSASVGARQKLVRLGTELLVAGVWLESRDPALAAETLLKAHQSFGRRAPFALHQDVLKRSMACARVSEDRELWIRTQLAYASACSRHHYDAEASRVLQVVGENVNEGSAGWVDLMLVSCQHLERSGDLEEAEQVAFEGLGWLEEQPECAKACAFRITLANTWAKTGALDDAIECLQSAMQDAQESQNLELESKVEAALGLLFMEKGELEQAREGLARALSLYRVLGNRVGEAKMLSGLAEVARGCGQRREAMEHLEEARVVAGRMGDVDSQALMSCHKASVLSELDRDDLATLEWTQAVRLAVEFDKPELERAVRIHRGILLHQRGELQTALSELGKAVSGLSEDSPHRVRVLAHLAGLHAALGSLERAEDCLEKGRACATVSSVGEGLLDVMEGLVDLRRIQNTDDVRQQGEFFDRAHRRLADAESSAGGESVLEGARILRRALRSQTRPGHARREV